MKLEHPLQWACETTSEIRLCPFMLLPRRWIWRTALHHSPPRIPSNLNQFKSRDYSTMSSSATSPNDVSFNQERLDEFHTHLKKSTRVLALCGAGLSASSGLPTFRGPGGLWRTHNSISLATPGAFEENPGLVWQYVPAKTQIHRS